MSQPLAPSELFVSLQGKSIKGFPCIDSTIYHTRQRTAYLKAPGVVLISKPDVSLAPINEFLNGFSDDLRFPEYLDDPDRLNTATGLCKFSGQLCYLSFGTKRSKNNAASQYFRNIKESGHGSVLEHASFSFLLYGISRSLTHELVRHRVGTAFSQVSQRYVSGRVLRFVERPEYQVDPNLHQRFETYIDQAAEEYENRTQQLLSKQGEQERIMVGESATEARKKVQQAARSCLPNETEAPIVFTANVRSLRHTIEMRASRHAETEIRELFMRMFLCLYQVEPILFEDYTIESLADGTYSVSTPYRKV